MADGTNLPIGTVVLFASDFAPAGWLACDGSMLSTYENPELFEVIGTTYGGEGSIAFALPNLRSPLQFGGGLYIIAAADQSALAELRPE